MQHLYWCQVCVPISSASPLSEQSIKPGTQLGEEKAEESQVHLTSHVKDLELFQPCNKMSYTHD